MSETYRRTKAFSSDLSYAVYWQTKRVRPLLAKEEIRRSAEAILIAEAAEIPDGAVTLRKLEVGDRYVKIQLTIDPRLAVHKAVKLLKQNSGTKLMAAYPELRSKGSSVWSKRYLVTTPERESDELTERFRKEEKGEKKNDRPDDA